LATKHARRPFSYVWIEAGSQPDLENELLQGNTFYPATVALNLKKNRFSPMVGSFTVEAVGDFLLGLLSGKESTVPLSGTAETLKVVDVTAWDGKDGEEPKEEL